MSVIREETERIEDRLADAPAAAITPTATVFPSVGRLLWTARLIGPVQAWRVWYFVCSLVGDTAARWVLNRVAPLAS